MEQDPERLRSRPKPRTAPPKVTVREREKTVSIDQLLAPPVTAPPIVEPAPPVVEEVVEPLTLGPTLSLGAPLSLSSLSLSPALTLDTLTLGEPSLSLGLTLGDDELDSGMSLSLKARDKLIRDEVLVIVMPPAPELPVGTERIWMPQWRRDACFELAGVAPWPMLKAGGLLNLDQPLESKRDMGMPMWNPDGPAGLRADRARDEDDMLNGWPSLPHRDPYGTPQRDGVALWDMVMARFAEHRYDLFHKPETLRSLPLHRYNCGAEWYRWGGLVGQTFTVEDIIAEQDRPDAEITSLLALVCDQICWQLPELLAGGQELKQWQELLEIDAQMLAPITNFVFTDLHDFPGSNDPRPVVRGKYRAYGQVDYVSSVGLWQDQPPWGVVGWRTLTVVPETDYEYLPRHICEVDCDRDCGMDSSIYWNGRWTWDRDCGDDSCTGCSYHQETPYPLVS